MSYPRIILSIAGLSVLFSFLASPTNCGQEKPRYYAFKLPCTTTLQVNSQTGVDVLDAAVCGSDTVTWQANGHTFVVFFKHDCPFVDPNGCKQIDDRHPKAGPIKASASPMVYDYGIVVDGKDFDPHIIGGG